MGNISSSVPDNESSIYKDKYRGQMFKYNEQMFKYNEQTKNEENYKQNVETMSKLNKFIFKTMNEKYYFITTPNNNESILLKRALCTGQKQIPVDFCYINQNNELVDYTVFMPLLIHKSKLNPNYQNISDNMDDVNNIILDFTISDSSSTNIYNDAGSTNNDPRTSGSNFFDIGIMFNGKTYGTERDSNINISKGGCLIYYLGSNGENNRDYNLEGGFCKNVLDYRRSIGKDFNDELNLCSDLTGNKNEEKCNGKHRQYGNEFNINSFRDCNCVLSTVAHEKYNDLSDQGLNKEGIAQNLDGMCQNKSFTFNTSNEERDLCINISKLTDVTLSDNANLVLTQQSNCTSGGNNDTNNNTGNNSGTNAGTGTVTNTYSQQGPGTTGNLAGSRTGYDTNYNPLLKSATELEKENNSKNNTGAIVGGAIGGVILLSIVGYLIYRNNKKNKEIQAQIAQLINKQNIIPN